MLRSSGKLQGKVAIITGASSGIGAGTAEDFAAEDCTIVIVGRNDVNLRETFAKCVKAGLSEDKILMVVADLTNEDDAKSVVTQAISRFGHLNILVNNAAIFRTGSIETFKFDDYDEIMNINVRSVLVLTKEATPHLIKTKGNIVNVSSTAGIRPFANLLSYCMSKAVLDQMTRCTALDLAPHGVRVNSVNSGVIMTEIHRRSGMTEEEYKKFIEHSKSTHAIGRIGTIKEVSQTILFLASEEASFITGENLAADGGRGLMSVR